MSKRFLPTPVNCTSRLRRAALPRAVYLALMSTLGLCEASLADSSSSSQQQPALQTYSIAPGTLDQVLNRFASHANILLAVDGSLTQHVASHPGLSGAYSVEKGLATLLQGTGLHAVKRADGSYILTRSTHAEPNALVLPDVEVSGRQQLYAQAPTIITRKDIERTAGSSNSDVFSTVTGVTANNIRNEAGALDIGIRGLQGEGRVPIFIDGSLQSTHTHRGYQGTSDRTYIDTDLISSIALEKGGSATATAFGAGAIGGNVSMQTLSADDILKEGETFGALVKLKTYNNNKTPDTSSDPHKQSYYRLSDSREQDHFSNGAGTLALAYKDEKLESVLAYSERSTGNYFAGKHGHDEYYTPIPDRFGVTQGYREPVIDKGQEVVNTSFESESILAKADFRLNEDHAFGLNYRNHKQEAGEVLAAYWYKDDEYDYNFKPLPKGVEVMPQWEPGYADVDTYRGVYRYTPVANDLINLNLEYWYTDTKLGQYNGIVSRYGPNALQYLHHYNNDRTGYSLSNTSNLVLPYDMPLSLTYGISKQTEEIEPSGKPKETRYLKTIKKTLQASRDGTRTEESAFFNAHAEINPFTLGMGLNVHKAKVEDHLAKRKLDYSHETDFTSTIEYQALEWLKLSAKYSNAYRLPSLFETTTSSEVVSYRHDYPLGPENSRLYEFGFTTNWSDLVTSGDHLQVSVNHFDNEVINYIGSAQVPSRQDFINDPKNAYPAWFTQINYDRYDTTGLELKANYDGKYFYTGVSYTRLQDLEMCSRLLAEMQGGDTCTEEGFLGSLTPTRIPPKEHLVFNLGTRLLNDQLDIGLFYKKHSAKEHPVGFMAGTGVDAISKIPSSYHIDLYGNYHFSESLSLSTTVTNATNQYYVSPGAIISMPEPGRTITVALDFKL